jgi:hypothetical protein
VSTDLESRIRDSIDRHVRAAHPDSPDLTGLVRKGTRRRALRMTGAVSAGAIVTAGVLVAVTAVTGAGGGRGDAVGPAVGQVQVHDHARGPAPVAAPRTVFVSRNAAWMDGRKIRVSLPFDDSSGVNLDGPAPVFLPASSSSIHVARDGIAFPGVRNRPTLLRRDGTVTPLAPRVPTLPGAVYDSWIAADTAGPLVAWDEYDGTTVRVIAYDTRTRRKVGEQTLRCDNSFAGGCQRPYVVSDGVVFIAGRKLVAWNPLAGTVSTLVGEVLQARNRVIQQLPLNDGSKGPRVDPARVGAGWVVADDLPGGAEANLSFDGGWLLDNSGADPSVTNWRDPGQVIRYGLPRHAEEVVFDTDGSVLVVTHAGRRYTGWDCTLDDGCRVVVPTQREEIRLLGWDT